MTVRPMTARDLPAVARIYQDVVGAPPPKHWRERLKPLLGSSRIGGAFVVHVDGERLPIGYAAAEVHSWEFGSLPAGWIFALAVRRKFQRHGAARALLDAAIARLRRLGVDTVRTMVSRDDVAVLSFFRRERFAAGPYTELELPLFGDGR